MIRNDLGRHVKMAFHYHFQVPLVRGFFHVYDKTVSVCRSKILSQVERDEFVVRDESADASLAYITPNFPVDYRFDHDFYDEQFPMNAMNAQDPSPLLNDAQKCIARSHEFCDTLSAYLFHLSSCGVLLLVLSCSPTPLIIPSDHELRQVYDTKGNIDTSRVSISKGYLREIMDRLAQCADTPLHGGMK